MSVLISKTFAGAGNRKTWTFSAWIKITADTSKLYTLMTQVDGWAGNSNGGIYLNGESLQSYNLLANLNDGTNSRVSTTAQLKDPTAWYHIVYRFDTTQSTNSDRARWYINGELQTELAHANYPGQNYDANFNTAAAHGIGRHTDADNYAFEGCMSHVHFCDGYSYGPDSFGETDSTTGEWKIKTSPSVSYGTNGFFILKDGNSVTDQSGQSNNWTVASGTLTKTEDNPSNNFATGNPHYWTNSAWNAASLTNGNNTLGGSISTDTYAGIWSTLVMPKKGKYYTEFKITAGSSGGGNAYVGIATPESVNEASNAGKYSGYANMGGNHGHEYSIYGSDGQKYVKENGGSQTGSTYGSNVTFGTNDIICIACDLDNNKLYFRKNGDAWMNSGNPESGSTGTGALSIINHDYHMFICDGGGGTFINADANFGNGYFGTTAVSSAGTNASNNGIFEYDVPAGYTALCTKGINSF